MRRRAVAAAVSGYVQAQLSLGAAADSCVIFPYTAYTVGQPRDIVVVTKRGRTTDSNMKRIKNIY